MTQEQFVNVNVLQNQASRVVKNLEKGIDYVIVRYSKPVGVLLSYNRYRKLIEKEQEHVKECKKCLGKIKNRIGVQ